MKELPRYKVVYEALRKLIAEGEFSAGDLLPSENEISRIYGIARPTARKALDKLVDEGFIYKHQGKGSIVKGAPKGIGILSLSGTTNAVGKETLTTKMIVKPELRSWNEAFSFSISDEEAADGCIYFERLREIGGAPMFFDITMLPNRGLPKFTSLNMDNMSLFESLRTHYQIIVTGGTQQLFAIKADKRLKDFFNIPSGHPILQLNRRIETNRKDFYIYSQVFCVTQGYGLTGSF